MKKTTEKPWKILSTFMEMKTPWMKLVGENLLDDDDNKLEYWRVEKPHGLLVITLQAGRFILPSPMYRPGIGQRTLDFCGGRINDPTALEVEATRIVQREFGIESPEPFSNFAQLTQTGWNIDSSFTNVKLYGCVVEIHPDVHISESFFGKSYENNPDGVDSLLKDLECLQCRSMLHEFKHLEINIRSVGKP